MDKHKIFQWFISLANTDLSKLPPSDKLKITAEGYLIASGHDPWAGGISDWALELFYLKVRERSDDFGLKDCQDKVKSFLEEIDGEIRLSEEPTPLVDFKSNEKTGEMLVPLDMRQPLDAPFYVNVKYDPHNKNKTINISYKTGNRDDQLYIYFLNSLNGLSWKAVRRCPECKNWFFHLTGRKKEFCSNKCAARKVSRGRRARLRDSNDEAYKKELKDGAKRARESYEKKVKGQHPKAIISRRPRKHEV